MYCTNCGNPILEGSAFCDQCGAPVQTNQSTRAYQNQNSGQAPEDKWISSNMLLCADGKYRWIYELNLFKNWSTFLLLWKIFGFIILAIFAVSTILRLSDWDSEIFLGDLKMYLIIFAGMTALVFVSYLIYAAIMGGKYCVLFEMDEEGVNHIQMPKQAQKAKILAGLTVLAGMADGNLSTIGLGIHTSVTSMYSEFKGVKKVKPYPRTHTIKVNGVLMHNQVYADTEEFDFVLDYICGHCPAVKGR